MNNKYIYIRESHSYKALNEQPIESILLCHSNINTIIIIIIKKINFKQKSNLK
jgi:hypothetical protein